MIKRLHQFAVMLLLALFVGACTLSQQQVDEIAVVTEGPSATITPDRALEVALLQTGEPLPSVTPFPSATLRPPPTDEPPTLTPTPTREMSATPTPTIEFDLDDLGLRGLNTETPLPGEGPGCQPRDDWKLRYEVQPGDALGNIAPRYATFADVLAEGNCLDDPNLVRIGQILRVPGDAHPGAPAFVCDPWELLAPFNGTVTVPGSGQLGFVWRGPDALRYLLRIYTQNPDGSYNQVHEKLVELVKEAVVDLSDIPAEGIYFWRVYPLGADFLQIACVESHLSQFYKAAAPVPTVGP